MGCNLGHGPPVNTDIFGTFRDAPGMKGGAMEGMEFCPRCGTPRQFVDNHEWLENGVIVQRGDRSHRMVLLESANLDHLYRGIEEIIGLPIERIVIETKRRATREYIDRLVPEEVKDMVARKEFDMNLLIQANNNLARIMGYGDVQVLGYRFEQDEGDFIRQRVRNPYSIPLWCGDLAGATEAVTRRDNDVEYKIVSPGEVEINAFPAEHPPQFQGRLQLKEYHLLAGDVELDRCGTCGGPAGLSAFKWNLEEGTITDLATGRRLAMLGPAYQEAVFDELEKELGEDIPRIIVEAQRRFVRSGFYKAQEIESEEQFRRLLALRGLGNLRTLSLKDGRLRVRLENAALHLMFVGLLQGYVETITGRDSSAEWELSPEGVLELEITAR
ncbi:hypothetical protein [Candidatus Solincola tengchongensis]|uniref:hypothetical protein n=1 Tax=Candidatus Solincola tengchongensis TaxID=2900693 RepID=UPI0025795F68|nr:hypothetical protein [Candidatus Solincola tengchongensis]